MTFVWTIENIFWLFVIGVWGLFWLGVVAIKTVDAILVVYERVKDWYQGWWIRRNVPELWPLYREAKKLRDKAKR